MYQKITLENGVRIIISPSDLKEIAIAAFVRNGPMYERKKENGISHYIEHMFFKGSKNWPSAFQIADAIESLGGGINAFTMQELVGYGVKLPAQHFDVGLSIISDMITNPLFPAETLERERRVIFEEMKKSWDNSDECLADYIWPELLWDNQPAGWPIAGTEETLNQLTRKELLRFFNIHYVGEATVVSVAGRFNTEDILDKISEAFSQVRVGAPVIKPVLKEMQSRPKSSLYYKETQQTRFFLGVRTPYRFASEKIPALILLTTILGQGMSSRMFMNVREERGLAYAVQTDCLYDTDQSFVITSAGVDHSKIEEAISAVLKEYQKIKEQKATIDELNKAKVQWIESFEEAIEKEAFFVTQFLGIQEALTNKTLTAEEECERYKKVTLEDVQEVARKIFVPKNLNLALIGPFRDKVRFDKLLEEF